MGSGITVLSDPKALRESRFVVCWCWGGLMRDRKPEPSRGTEQATWNGTPHVIRSAVSAPNMSIDQPYLSLRLGLLGRQFAGYQIPTLLHVFTTVVLS